MGQKCWFRLTSWYNKESYYEWQSVRIWSAGNSWSQIALTLRYWINVHARLFILRKKFHPTRPYLIPMYMFIKILNFWTKIDNITKFFGINSKIKLLEITLQDHFILHNYSNLKIVPTYMFIPYCTIIRYRIVSQFIFQMNLEIFKLRFF